MLRGLIRSGVKVSAGSKLIEVDQVHDSAVCNIITSKMMAIGEGVLQVIKLKFDPDREEGR